MPDVTLELSELYAPLRFREKARLVVAMGFSAVVMTILAWSVLAPFDPRGAISLLVHAHPVRAGLLLFVLTLVASGVGWALAGPKLPDVGLFVTAFGLAVLNLRAGTMEYLLLTAQGPPVEARATLSAKLIVELWGWMAIVFAGHLLAGFVLSRMGFRGPVGDPRQAVKRSSGMVQVIEFLIGAEIDAKLLRKEVRAGLGSTLVGTAAGAVVISLAIAYSPVASIDKGQVYFAVGAAFFVGALIGHQTFHPLWSVWSMLPVPLLCTLGYALAWFRPDVQNSVPMVLRTAREQYNLLAMMPPNDFARATPLDYVGIGLAAAVAGFWFSRHTHRMREEAQE